MALRAVYDDGTRHSEGKVRGMWSSGIVLETDVRPSVGSPIALVILSGGFDGMRLSAKVAGVEKNGLVLDLPGLDTARFARLQALVEGKPLTMSLPMTAPVTAPPAHAPTFIISGGGEDELGDPTDVSELPADAGPVELTVRKRPAGSRTFAPAPVTVPGAPPPPMSTEELEAQLIELGRRNATLVEENARLAGDVTRLSALKRAVEDELRDALAKLDAIERSLKR